MKTVLLVDIGSTFTKVAAIDLKKEDVLATAQCPTTLKTDVTIGLQGAVKMLLSNNGGLNFDCSFACSSAGGGLRMAVIGLVPDLSVEAARRAALGAGARIVASYSYVLSHRELEELERLSPDIILLSGGTDGGDEKTITSNAMRLAKLKLDPPFVIAGNKSVAYEIESILRSAGKSDVRVAENVMPELGKLCVEPVRSLLREIFVEKIIVAKGIEKVKEQVDSVIMPTPMAVLEASKLLAEGTKEEEGMGDLVVVEVGGATTNVHSVCKGMPTRPAILKSLQEPFAKRTVEGDLGVRHSALSLLEVAGEEKVLENAGVLNVDVQHAVRELVAHPEKLPISAEEFALDEGLASAAIELAMERHAGTIEVVPTSVGDVCLQYGKDLTEIRHVVGTGGPILHSREPRKLLEKILFDERRPLLLRPKRPCFHIDEKYILYGVGLLAEIVPDKALRIIKKHIRAV
jgi:uncharacterized protein (TIGR01319 family)